MIDKTELCLKILDFLGFKDVSLHERTLKFTILQFTSKSGKAVYPLFHQVDNLLKLLCSQSISFDCLCEVFLNDIVLFKYVDGCGGFEKHENNPFYGLSAEEALVFLDMNGGF